MTAVVEQKDELSREVARRRTFAIISHPDAGKTTLTEKLLLYGGAIEEAGSVRARKAQRHTTSDWMAIEQSRGISITSTVLQFEYEGAVLNLLDTPGHQDFSEDTYRTLAATDSAVMVLDGAKGIEPQTRKLFEVCRMRHIPILCFINKLDQPARDPFELIGELERELNVSAVPMNWPIGDGPTFQGVFDLRHQQVLRFERTRHGASIAPVTVSGLDDPTLEDAVGPTAWQELRDAAELLEGAGHAFDRKQFEYGRVIPVFFGSAVNNFGVEPFLRAVIELAPPPSPRPARQNGEDIELEPISDTFTGFVFKIQANMDKRHRDRLAFMRITSGVFEKDMSVQHARLRREVRMTRPHRLFARERETIDRAYPGDVIGFVQSRPVPDRRRRFLRSAGRVRAHPALRPRALRHAARQGHDAPEAVPERAGAAGGGRRDAGLRTARRPEVGADPGGRRRAAVRGAAVASRDRVQRRDHHDQPLLQTGPLG